MQACDQHLVQDWYCWLSTTEESTQCIPNPCLMRGCGLDMRLRSSWLCMVAKLQTTVLQGSTVYSAREGNVQLWPDPRTSFVFSPPHLNSTQCSSFLSLLVHSCWPRVASHSTGQYECGDVDMSSRAVSLEKIQTLLPNAKVRKLSSGVTSVLFCFTIFSPPPFPSPLPHPRKVILWCTMSFVSS